VAYTIWRGGVGAIIILPIVLCRAGAIYLRANMIPISWQAGGAHSIRAKRAPLPSTNRREIRNSPVDSTQGIHGRASAYPLLLEAGSVEEDEVL